MGRILIVRNGERTTRHAIPEGRLTIGRDASCDLRFTDKRLSRQHARLEVTPDAVRLCDLDSRNGSWINGERIKERVLAPEDEATIGPLRVRIENVPHAPLHLVPPSAPRPLVENAEADTFPGPASATMDLEKTLPLGLRSPFLPEHSGTEGQPGLTVPAPVEKIFRRTANWPWATKFALTLAAVGLVSYFALAIPLLRAMRSSVKDESLLRARALLRYLSASNEAALAEKKLQQLSLDALFKEPGVKDAIILDLDGKVLAPSVRAGEMWSRVEGVQTKIPDIYTFYLGRTGSGDYNLVLPMTRHGRRIGIAVLTYSAAGLGGRGSVAVELILGFLVIAAATAGAAVIGKRMTLRPMGMLTDDVEAVIKADEDFVPSEQPYRELADLAKSINRLIERSPEPNVLEVPVKKAVNAEALKVEPPSLDAVAPPPPLALATPPETDGGPGLTIDESYIVTSVDEATASILETSAKDLVGKHLLESIGQQEVLERVLDLLNTVSDGVEIAERVEETNVKVTVGRYAEHVFVKLERS